MTFLSKSDINFLTGNGPKLVSSVPMIRKQGNGNFTGFVRKTYSDGVVADSQFIVNARSREDVATAYAEHGYRH